MSAVTAATITRRHRCAGYVEHPFSLHGDEQQESHTGSFPMTVSRFEEHIAFVAVMQEEYQGEHQVYDQRITTTMDRVHVCPLLANEGAAPGATDA